MNIYIMIIVMAFPMILFTIYPGLKLSEYLDKKYKIGESKKRTIMLSVMVIFALMLSTALNLINVEGLFK